MCIICVNSRSFIIFHECRIWCRICIIYSICNYTHFEATTVARLNVMRKWMTPPQAALSWTRITSWFFNLSNYRDASCMNEKQHCVVCFEESFKTKAITWRQHSSYVYGQRGTNIFFGHLAVTKDFCRFSFCSQVTQWCLDRHDPSCTHFMKSSMDALNVEAVFDWCFYIFKISYERHSCSLVKTGLGESWCEVLSRKGTQSFDQNDRNFKIYLHSCRLIIQDYSGREVKKIWHDALASSVQ